jgi:hypothetical protein
MVFLWISAATYTGVLARSAAGAVVLLVSQMPGTPKYKDPGLNTLLRACARLVPAVADPLEVTVHGMVAGSPSMGGQDRMRCFFSDAWQAHLHEGRAGTWFRDSPDRPQCGTLGSPKADGSDSACICLAPARSHSLGLSMGYRSWDLVTLDKGQTRLHTNSHKLGGAATTRDDPWRHKVTIRGMLVRSLFMGRLRRS